MAGYPQVDPAYVNGELEEALEESQTHDEPIIPAYEGEQRRIPLVCAICPKNSRFSDISHLLTHISSKGHLSTYFDLSISRDTDAEAAIALEEFDNWFEDYGIGELLRLRKTARATRGALQGRRSQTPMMASRRIPTRRGGRGSRGGARSRGRNRYAAEQVDIKYESDDDMGIGDAYDTPEGAPLHSWTAAFRRASHEDLEGFIDEDDSSKYEPSDGDSSFPSENTIDTTETDTGTLILKGAVYPGMGGFDAAREEQRRKRNQRKPPAVLHQLEVNSVSVTTDEEIFDCNLDYQRTRDVYDEPSIDGSVDEDGDEDAEKKRKGRGSQTKVASNARKTRSSTISREHSRVTRSTRVTRANTSAAHLATPVARRASLSGGRATRSTTSRGSMPQTRLPLHGHGFQGDTGMFHDAARDGDDGEGWTSLSNFARRFILTPAEEQALLHGPRLRNGDDSDHERLPGLALRPGNPNLSFASPTPGLKQSPSLYAGKENNHLTLKSPTTSSNPYLHSNDSIENSGYNPLYVQPRDGVGFRMYSSYDDDVKPVASGFQPINGNGGFNSLQMPTNNAAYNSNQPGGDEFDI
ncbi:hypothetical protein F5B20DRAFT_596212 [Whalleya microplaca]|nr:hypothetical protein F5B20DRAFT_596212 [Whalleya microplaca]